MTPLNLAHSLLCLRGLVEGETQTNEILKSIDSFSIQINTCQKHLCQVEAEVQQLRSQAKKMKSRTRKLENQVCKCTKERDNLASELEKVQVIHKTKIQKITQMLSNHQELQPLPKKQKNQKKVSKCSYSVQCQVLTQSTILELQEKSKILLRKMENLEQKYQEQCNENKAKDVYIDQLLTAFETERRRNHQNSQEGDEKENDNSTLDNDSERDSQFALPEWLESLESEQAESMEESDGLEEIEEKLMSIPEKSWLGTLRENSLKLCSFIFG